MLVFGEPFAGQFSAETLLARALIDGGPAGGELEAHADVVDKAGDLLRTAAPAHLAEQQLAEFRLLAPVNDAAFGFGSAARQFGDHAAVPAGNVAQRLRSPAYG